MSHEGARMMKPRMPVKRACDIKATAYQVDEVEAREQGGRQLDVLDNRQLGVVATLDRVGGRQDRRARVEGADDTRLSDRHLGSRRS